MRLLRGLLARARDAGFSVADYAVVQIKQSTLNQRREGKNDGGSITTCVRYERSFLEPIAMQFRNAVNRARGDVISKFGILVVKLIHSPRVRLYQPPCPAQIDYLHALLHGFRNPFAGNFMRSSKKKTVHSLVAQIFPGELLQGKAAISSNMGIKLV